MSVLPRVPSSTNLHVFRRRIAISDETVDYRIADNISTVIATVLLLPLKVVDTTKPAACSSPPLHVGVVSPIVGNLRNTLREIDVNAVIVDQHAVHLEVCLFALFLVRILNESILKAVTRLLIAYDLAA